MLDLFIADRISYLCIFNSGFRDAWMTLQNGCSLIVFNSTHPRRKYSGVHPFDVSIRFHSPVCVSASTYNCSVRFCPRPRNISGLWRQHEDSCLEGGVQLFRGAAATPQHSFVGYEASLCVARRVIGFVSPWLRQCHTRRHHGSVDGQIAVRAQRVCAADLRFP